MTSRASRSQSGDEKTTEETELLIEQNQHLLEAQQQLERQQQLQQQSQHLQQPQRQQQLQQQKLQQQTQGHEVEKNDFKEMGTNINGATVTMTKGVKEGFGLAGGVKNESGPTSVVKDGPGPAIGSSESKPRSSSHHHKKHHHDKSSSASSHKSSSAPHKRSATVDEDRGGDHHNGEPATATGTRGWFLKLSYGRLAVLNRALKS